MSLLVSVSVSCVGFNVTDIVWLFSVTNIVPKFCNWTAYRDFVVISLTGISSYVLLSLLLLVMDVGQKLWE